MDSAKNTNYPFTNDLFIGDALAGLTCTQQYPEFEVPEYLLVQAAAVFCTHYEFGGDESGMIDSFIELNRLADMTWLYAIETNNKVLHDVCTKVLIGCESFWRQQPPIVGNLTEAEDEL